MSNQLKNPTVPPSDLELPEALLSSPRVRELHAAADNEWGPLQQSARQMAAARALWSHAVCDPVAGVLAGESLLRNLHDKMKKDSTSGAHEVHGVMIAARTLWFDARLRAAIESLGGGETQVVLLGAGMDARAYRLSCLEEATVYEVDFQDLLDLKAQLLAEAAGTAEQRRPAVAVLAKSLVRVPADIREENWLAKLKSSGFDPEKKTVWILEGILYYLSRFHAMQVLQAIVECCCRAPTSTTTTTAAPAAVLLADFMNKSATSLSRSMYHFYDDWPDRLLPSIGFKAVKLSQVGDPDARFGLLPDPQNVFDKLRNLPRSTDINPDDGTPCCRLYLVEASLALPAPSHHSPPTT